MPHGYAIYGYAISALTNVREYVQSLINFTSAASTKHLVHYTTVSIVIKFLFRLVTVPFSYFSPRHF